MELIVPAGFTLVDSSGTTQVGSAGTKVFTGARQSGDTVTMWWSGTEPTVLVFSGASIWY